MKRNVPVLVTCLLLILVVLPVSGGTLQEVPPGGTVFIGEEGLNLTGIPSGTTLSWYHGNDIVGSSAPAATITVADNTSFYVSPSQFSSHNGNWYTGDTSQVGIVVSDPSLVISVYDQKSQKDVTGKFVPQGNFLTFRVETNMNVVPVQRPGSGGFLTIKVRAPDGTVYSQLYQDNETLLNLTGLAPDAMPWYWVPPEKDSEDGWATGFLTAEDSRVYAPGNYMFWTESDLNGMKENYRDPPGNDFTRKTVSAHHNVTITSSTVKIKASNESVNRGKTFTVTISGSPENEYYLWVRGTSSMSGMAGNQPPGIILSQEGVRMDPKAGPWPIGRYVFQGSTRTIQQDVAKYYGSESVNGVIYYALVTLSSNGTRAVGFSTNPGTRDQKYTLRVERPEPYDPPESDTGTERGFKTDTVDVTIEKGSVNVSDQPPGISRAGTYYLGEEITLTGTNSETPFTYLFITGPNLPAGGGSMTDPRKPVSWEDPDSYAYAEVIDEEWEYVWETARLNLDNGGYTIYAVTNPVNRSTLADNFPCNPEDYDPDDPETFPCTLFSTISLFLKKPFISAQVLPATVASGDKVYIRGIAAGQPEDGVAVWLIGRNKVLYGTPAVNSDGTFELEFSQAETADMTSGQYFVVVQHPMYNEIFDVWPSSSVIGYNNRDLVVGSYPLQGNTLFRLQGDGSLQGPDAAEALIQALNNQMVDDIYARLQFLVEDPVITVAPVSEKQVGDVFTIAGTTNLAVDDLVLVEVVSSSFEPTMKADPGGFSGVSGSVPVRKGTGGLNRWAFPVNTTAFRPDEYIVQVTGITVPAETSTTFNVVAFNQATHVAVQAGPEVPEEPGPLENVTTPDETGPDDNDKPGGPDYISVGIKPSKLARIIGETPVTTPDITVTHAKVTAGTATAEQAGTVALAKRPTVQPGMGPLPAMVGLIIVFYCIRRKI